MSSTESGKDQPPYVTASSAKAEASGVGNEPVAGAECSYCAEQRRFADSAFKEAERYRELALLEQSSQTLLLREKNRLEADIAAICMRVGDAEGAKDRALRVLQNVDACYSLNGHLSAEVIAEMDAEMRCARETDG